MILNIRGIRAMGFEHIFRSRFDESTDVAMRTGMRGAFVEGCTYGVASSLIYMSEALLFYVGARLVVNGTYTYLQFVQVLNLVVFSVSIGSQLMTFSQSLGHFCATYRLYSSSTTYCEVPQCDAGLESRTEALRGHR